MAEKSSFSVVVDGIRDLIDDSSLEFAAFRLSQGDNAQIRRVLFIPTGGVNGSVEQSGPNVDKTTGALDDIGSTDLFDVECHIYGDDFDDMLEIRVRVLNAVWLVLHTSGSCGAFDIVTQSSDGASYSLGGREKIVQHMTWHLNVPALDAFMQRLRSIKLAAASMNSQQFDSGASEHTDEGPLTEVLP